MKIFDFRLRGPEHLYFLIIKTGEISEQLFGVPNSKIENRKSKIPSI
jgi:hypothetical protein